MVNTCVGQGPGSGIQIKELSEALPVVVSPPSADKAVLHVETPEKEISRPLGNTTTATMEVMLPELPSGSVAQSSTLETLPPSPFMGTEVGNTEELRDGALQCQTIPLDGEDVQPQGSGTTLIADTTDLQELLSQSLSALTFSRFPTMARAQVGYHIEVFCSLRRNGTFAKSVREQDILDGLHDSNTCCVKVLAQSNLKCS